MLSELPILYSKPRLGAAARARSIEFELCEASGDAVCPITQELISESELDFLQNTTLVKDMPNLRSMKLRCGHEFSAMNLVYHWGRNRSTLCPVCRGGLEHAYLDLKRLPVHFKRRMGRKIRSENKRDAAERLQENVEAARQMQRQIAEWSWFDLIVPNYVCLKVVRRYAETGEFSYSNGLSLMCNVRIVGDQCIFTANVLKAELDRMGEFSVFGYLYHGNVETRFPASAWHEMQDMNNTIVLLDEESMMCNYSLELVGDMVKVVWQIDRDMFKLMAEHHLFFVGL